MKDVRELGTILGLWAHPDDETYLSAGLMAAAVRAGSRVACVTATRGEAGTWDEKRWPTPKMGEIREAELARCFEILGVKEHHWLEVYDGTAHEVPLEDGVQKMLPFVEEVQPDTVLDPGMDRSMGRLPAPVRRLRPRNAARYTGRPACDRFPAAG